MADSTAGLRELLQKIAKENNLSNYDINIKPISSGGANYTSQLYSATISNGSKKLNLFGKVIILGEKFRSRVQKNTFEIEPFVYGELSKIYHQLEAKHSVPREHRLEFPKLYGMNSDPGQEILVLEDLSAQGYSVYNRFKSVEWPYAFKAIKELAKLHALSFAFEQEHPKEFEEVQNFFVYPLNNNDEGKAMLMALMENAISAAVEEHKLRLQEFISKSDVINSFVDYPNPVKRRVLLHGDFRVSNLMHKVDDEGIYQIKILDYQTIRAGSPVADLLYFIFTGTDEEFRAKHYLPLLDHYYSQLSLAMRRLGLRPNEIYSREDFDTELQMKLPYGLIVALCLLPIIMVDEEDAPVMDKDTDMAAIKINKIGKYYPERINGIINDYVRWKVL